MALPGLNRIEETIGHLSRKEQLWLIEKIAHYLRKDPVKSDMRKHRIFKNQLAVMASDPDIQTEL